MVIIITIKMTCLFHDFRKGSTPQLDGALHGSQRGAQRTDPDPRVLAGNVEVSGSLISSNLSDNVDGSEIRHQLRLVVEIPLFTGFFLTFAGGCLGFLNHQQYWVISGETTIS